jgi:hypothetical protein
LRFGHSSRPFSVVQQGRTTRPDGSTSRHELLSVIGRFWQELHATHASLRSAREPRSGNDVRGKLVLDSLDPILEKQLALFQPLDRELVGIDRQLERYDFGVEGAMFIAELNQKLPQFTVISSLHGRPAKP